MIEHKDDKTVMPSDRKRKHNSWRATEKSMTSKEKAYVEYRLSHPKATKAEAVRHAYDVKDDIKRKTLDNMASKIEKRKPVMDILHKHAEKAEAVLSDVMQYSHVLGKSGTKEGAAYANTAMYSANAILDRVYGKATQNVNVNQQSININVDLTMSDMD